MGALRTDTAFPARRYSLASVHAAERSRRTVKIFFRFIFSTFYRLILLGNEAYRGAAARSHPQDDAVAAAKRFGAFQEPVRIVAGIGIVGVDLGPIGALAEEAGVERALALLAAVDRAEPPRPPRAGAGS